MQGVPRPDYVSGTGGGLKAKDSNHFQHLFVWLRIPPGCSQLAAQPGLSACRSLCSLIQEGQPRPRPPGRNEEFTLIEPCSKEGSFQSFEPACCDHIPQPRCLHEPRQRDNGE
jgi:hypothetical protein